MDRSLTIGVPQKSEALERREDQVTPARTASPMLDRFTTPADFLKLKAAIQDATQPAERSNGVSAI
ncbi:MULTISPECIES: hypothetical protein [unclassified Bradyrhizobium]|uniref:hypothetical protein n=1 Tax=Bradyrhizobium sp. USDA 4541 TaxID=2817704 RepID=UPI0020A27365|nr:hypothetical protein [Bradyrhizobium sp. USDA 4541]MCP1850120.1 hypothetical protein [Bradyrhizobium sp. USDA 4541]